MINDELSTGTINADGMKQETTVGPAKLDEDRQEAAGWLSEALSKSNDVGNVIAPSETAATNKTFTMGDAILRGMQSASTRYKEVSSEVKTALSSENNERLGLKSVLEMHMKFIEISMEAEVVSKVVSKSAQHIDQLSKLQ